MTSRSERMKRDVIAVMRIAGIRPEIIYAYDRTGFILDKAGYKNLSPEDKAEYDAAIDEFIARKGP